MKAKKITLFQALLMIKNTREMEAFFKDLCTPQELQDLHDRWEVCQLLAQEDLSYLEIYALTGISLTTIGRVARFLNQEPHKGYRTVLNRFDTKS